jgi:mannose-1-phosphate guanylyltransferase/mannose-6-phosphate isomerase
MSMILQTVILSGGSGTRLWPLSREKYPKQLLSLTGFETMLQATATRMQGFVGEIGLATHPIVVSNEEYRFITAEQLREAGCQKPTLILEPVGRNTAPALTLAALTVSQEAADPLLLVMPADHVIRDNTAFHMAVNAGIPQAMEGAVVTFGIVPDRPETGYGYIQLGSVLEGFNIRRLQGFVEKPDVETARHYVGSGEFLWNSGIFMLRAKVWLKAMAHFRSDILTACEKAVQSATLDLDFIRVGQEAFAHCPADSIDYAVMEKLPSTPELGIPAYVVPLGAGWSDVGAWDAVWQVSDKDENGNACQGKVILEDSRDCLVLSDDRLVACLGLSDLVVVDTPDALLVANKHKTQQIKKVVAKLKADGYPHTETPRKVFRPWGSYDSIDAEERFQVKRIMVKPGAALSLQMHHHRAEHWIVVKGTARITKGDETLLLSENQSIYIPLGVPHRLENPGKIPLELIEVQSGSYLGEDDIVRFDDQYGRVAKIITE